MAKYNLSHKKPFEILNITGSLKDSNPQILIFGSYEEEIKIGDTFLKKESFYGREIINERGIWSATACFSGYRNKNRNYKSYGVIIKTLPIPPSIECITESQIINKRPYYLCNPLVSELVLAITPWKIATKTLHSLALREASDFLERGPMHIGVGGDCDSGAHYYHDRHLDIKVVRDFITGKEYSEWIKLNEESHRFSVD